MSFWRPQQSKTNPNQFSLHAQAAGCVGPPGKEFWMGGVAMAASIEAMQDAFGKKILWATIQFVAPGRLNDQVEITCDALGGGRSVTLAQCKFTVDGRLTHNVIAALGGREGMPEQQFLSMPDVPLPDDCPPKEDDKFLVSGNLLDQIERRTALEDNDAGTEYLWVRPKFDTPLSAASLAIISDLFLGAHSRTRQGSSLDNTFRLHNVVESEWILNVTKISAFSAGAASGTIYQFAQDGTLLSTCSQTGLLPIRQI